MKLEDKLRAKLNRARISRRTNLSKHCRRHVGTGNGLEVSVIENVESFRTQLQLRGLAKANVLQHRKVHAERRRADDNAAASVSDDVANAGVHGRITLETRSIEPMLLRLGRG